MKHTDPLLDEYSAKAADEHKSRNIQPAPNKTTAPIETREELIKEVAHWAGRLGLKKKRR